MTIRHEVPRLMRDNSKKWSLKRMHKNWSHLLQHFTPLRSWLERQKWHLLDLNFSNSSNVNKPGRIRSHSRFYSQRNVGIKRWINSHRFGNKWRHTGEAIPMLLGWAAIVDKRFFFYPHLSPSSNHVKGRIEQFNKRLDKTNSSLS